MMTEDLFGNLVEETQAARGFTDDEIQTVISDAPKILLDELSDCLAATRKARLLAADRRHEMTEAKKRFWLNLAWVYELGETACAMPFDLACALEGVDSEAIRNRMSTHFSEEIREFFAAYSSARPLDAARVARKFNPYISVGH